MNFSVTWVMTVLLNFHTCIDLLSLQVYIQETKPTASRDLLLRKIIPSSSCNLLHISSEAWLKVTVFENIYCYMPTCMSCWTLLFNQWIDFFSGTNLWGLYVYTNLFSILLTRDWCMCVCVCGGGGCQYLSVLCRNQRLLAVTSGQQLLHDVAAGWRWVMHYGFWRTPCI